MLNQKNFCLSSLTAWIDTKTRPLVIWGCAGDQFCILFYHSMKQSSKAQFSSTGCFKTCKLLEHSTIHVPQSPYLAPYFFPKFFKGACILKKIYFVMRCFVFYTDFLSKENIRLNVGVVIITSISIIDHQHEFCFKRLQTCRKKALWNYFIMLKPP